MAAQPLSERFRAVLDARREAWNERFTRRGRGIDAAAFLRYLRDTVDPLVDAAGRSAGDAAAETSAAALFDLGLVGLARGWIGEREASDLERTLASALPVFGNHWHAAPAALLRALGNGYERLERAFGAARACQWISALAALAPALGNRAEILDAGLVLAWRGGLAEARSAALARALARDAAFRRRVLDADEIDPRPERRFAPLAHPATPLVPAVATRLGGFVGFGGPFRVPPRAAAIDGRLVACDGDACVEVHADAFGARWIPAPWARDRAAASAKEPTPSRRIAPPICHLDAMPAGALASLLARFTAATSVASADGMAAITTADSHQLVILGWLPEAGA